MPQKKNIKKIEKQQNLRQQNGKVREKNRVEKNVGKLDIPNIDTEEFLDQLKRMKAITPTQIAAQLNIRVSIAKRVLEELKEKSILELVSRSHNLKVYAVKTS